MKAGEYISLFGVLHTYPIQWKGGFLHELIENDPNIELTDMDLEHLYSAELHSFAHHLSHFRVEGELLSVLRETFDEYRQGGGNPEYWLGTLLDEMVLNPHLFPTIYRGQIEKNLLQWMENWRTILSEGQPPANDPDTKQITHHEQAMYLHYIKEMVTREKHKNSIFNKWSHWHTKTNRITPNSYFDLKAKTQLKHLEAVRKRLIFEDKRNEAYQCQQDIDALTEKMAKA